MRKQRLDISGEAAIVRALLEASPLGIGVMDADGNPVFYNPRCEELHGIALSEASGKGWEHAVHPDDRARIDASWYAAASKSEPWSDTYRFLHPDGRVVWVSGRAAPYYVDGQVAGFVGTLEDITAEREAREQAERATQIRDELLAVVAHDLRSPLNTIALTVEALLAESSGSRERGLQVIQRSADSMQHLISDLLDLSLRSGRFNVKRSRLDLEALCHETMGLFSAEAHSRGIALSCHVDAGLPTVRGDARRVGQLLSNLIGNALKFTRRPGEVVLRAGRCDEGVRVTVEDDGRGIPPEHLPHLFEPDWQGSGKSGSGTGLGLSIARSIVEAHGGSIRAESTPGEGATISFVLPSSA